MSLFDRLFGKAMKAAERQEAPAPKSKPTPKRRAAPLPKLEASGKPAARILGYIDWKGLPETFTEGYAAQVRWRDAGYIHNRDQYLHAHKMLKKYIDGHSTAAMDSVRGVIDREGFDDAVVERTLFVKDKNYHFKRNSYINARKFLFRYIKNVADRG